MTKDVRDAVHILGELAKGLDPQLVSSDVVTCYAYQTLNHAIRHLAYPDRDTYPKTRRGTKGAPVVRR